VPSLNPFGSAFKNSAAGPDSPNGFAQIEFVDSDGDNFTNLHEILLFNQPGAPGNFPANANAAPVLNAIGNKNLNEGQTLNFTVTTTDAVAGLSPLLSVTNLPPGATFVDNRDRTGTFNWVTDFSDGGSYPGIQFTSNDGLLTDTETISITVTDINEAPEMDLLENKLGYSNELLEFDVSATDLEGATVALSVTGLPTGAAFVDNGDGTGTFSWTPGTGDIGVYPGVTFTAEDDAAQTDSVAIALFVTAPPKLFFSDESPVLNSNSFDDEVLDYRADLATDGAGNWVAVWYISDTELIVAASSADNGLTWSVPVQVSPLDGSDEAPQIATDKAGNWVVVWRSSNNLGNTIGDDPDILYARSEDNGATWSEALPLNPEAASDGSTQDRGANIETDGNVWVATWMTTFLGDSSVYLMRSDDAGLTWDPPIYVGNAFVESFPDTPAPRLAADGAGNWVAVWSLGQQFGGTGNDVDVWVTRSSNGAVTWSSSSKLNTNAVSDSGDDILPSIATDAAGVWLAVWRSTDSLGGTIGTDSDILMARSLDNGATWSAPAPVAMDAPYDGFSWDYTPSIATDKRGVWVSMWHSDGSLIRMCYSTDDGTTWSFPEVLNVLNDDTTRLPQAVPDGKGSWLATWDTNENPLDTGFDFDLMLSAAYAPNVQSITRNGDELTNANGVEFTVTFDEEVTGVDTGDFALSTNKILSGAAVFSVTPESASVYTVLVATGAGTGTLALQFVDDDTVFNSAGNVAGGPGEGNGDVQGLESYVVDKVAPQITLLGDPVVNLTVGDAYVDEGATASDDRDGQITGAIVPSSNVNTLVAGNYSVAYNVSDEAGNAANQVTRTVNVVAGAEGEGEGIPEGEGVVEGEGSIDGEGVAEGEGIVEGEGEPGVAHSADQDSDQQISLTELLRLVQLYNLVNFGCDVNGEDGFAALSADQTCPPHASDYDPQNWRISLNELIRLIQFYNADGYASCQSGEDDYCPVTK
jgi:hypothetical protein